jgi:hypothetical protein
MRKRAWLAGVVLGVAILAAGCGAGGRDGANQNAQAEGVAKVARDAGVKLSLAVDRERPREDQRVIVTVEGEAEPGVTLTLQDYAPALRANPFEFTARALPDEPPTAAADGKIVRRRQFELEFFLPGEYELPGAKATIVDERRAEAAAPPIGEAPADAATPPMPAAAVKDERELQTEPIKLVVAALSEAEPTPEELATLPMPAPLELADEAAEARRRNWIAAAVAAMVAIALGAVWWFRRRRVAEAVEVVIPPYEWAVAQLAALVRDDPLARGMAQEFYYRLSAIVRGYIERRFAVAAAEMTTQEFLVAMSRDRRFAEDHRRRLEEFMLASDMVKYALYRPSSSESDAALAAAREYIEQTRPVETDLPSSAATESAAA